MEYQDRELKVRAGDTSTEAVARRLKAARMVTGMTGKDIAEQAGIKYTTFHAQERGGSPSVKLMTYYFRAFQIDYNFVLAGEMGRLPADTAQAILQALAELCASREAQGSSPNRSQAAKTAWQDPQNERSKQGRNLPSVRSENSHNHRL